MIVVIDNYDSFTYNLAQYLGELGADPWVFRNDRISMGELRSMQPSHIVISPGPGTPERSAGISNDVIRHFHGRTPILGVCLGHQCIGHAFGARVGRAPRLMHGKISSIRHRGGRLFSGIPTTFDATRYHSLIVQEPLPDTLEVLARTVEGEIMAMRHRAAPTYGVQFHPESILTGHGKRLLSNFLQMSVADIEEMPLQGAAEGDLPAIEMPLAIARTLDGEHLSAPEAEAVMELIMEGKATPAQIGAYLAALRAKDATVDEIGGFVRAMRRHVTPVRSTRRPLVDTCGTGGDGAQSFNISTTAAFVVAGAGVAVAKHGNRSVSSRCGSADVLQALGVKLELTPDAVGHCIDQVGLGFLFAPTLHPAMKHAIGPRREMGVRTVFNILGPLTNPAGASVQVVGVYSPDLVETLARVLHDVGTDAAYVVSSADGLDELTTAGSNTVASLRDGRVSLIELDATEYGLPRADASRIRGGDADENARIVRQVLSGVSGPPRDVVILNAGMALVAAGVADDAHTGLAMASQSIDSGAALRVLEDLVAYTQGAAS